MRINENKTDLKSRCGCKRVKGVVGLVICVQVLLILVGVVNAECPSGMISYWTFDDGTAVDTFGSNDGTNYGATATTGKVGQAFDFDGVDYVTNASIIASGGDLIYTYSAWFKPESSITTSSSVRAMFGSPSISGPDTSQVLLYFGSTTSMCTNEIITIALSTGMSGYGRTCYYSPTSIDTSWHHIGVVWNGAQYEVYLDGTKLSGSNYGTASGHAPLFNITNGFYVGQNSIGSVSYFNGIIDEVAIFDRALSADEISDLYDLGVAGDGYCYVEPSGCIDIDNDGYGAEGSNLTLCTYHIAYDCNDASNATYPGAYDIPNDSIDQDCSGSDAIANYKTDIIFTGESYAGLYYYYGDDIGYEITFKKDDVLSNEDVSNIVINLTDPQGNVIKSQSIESMAYTSTGTWTGLFTTDDLSNVFDDKVALNVYVYGITSNLLTSSSHSDENLVTGTAPSLSSAAYTVTTTAISNYTVKDLVVNSTQAKIDWTGISLDLNARSIDFDSAATFADRFVKVDTAGYSELNNSAALTFDNVDCSSPYVFYSSTANDRETLLSENNQCLPPQCTNIQCIGSTLTVDVLSFSGYAAEGNANLAIDADDPKFVGAEVHFTADYRNVTDNSFISGAACTIYFTDGSYAMDEGSVYTYNRTFVTEGLKDYNVTCSKTGFSTLTAFDNATITSAEIPEFSILTLGLGLITILAGLLIMRRKR